MDGGKWNLDIGEVEADVTKLMPNKEECVPTMQFERALVTEKEIKVFEKKKYLPAGARRAPTDELIPEPRHGEAVVFRDFFIAGLRFPCNTQLPVILNRYRAKLHHLTPNSFIELSKFYWVQCTFGGCIDVDCFAHLYGLHIQKKRLLLKGRVVRSRITLGVAPSLPVRRMRGRTYLGSSYHLHRKTRE